MGRIADALKRSREPAGDHTGRAHHELDDGLSFFGSNEPAVPDPWGVSSEDDAMGAATREPRHEPTPRAAPSRSGVASKASVSSLSREYADKLVVHRQVSASAREQYHRLAAALFQAQLERGLKVVMITSTAPREGKTLTAINLALTFTEGYQRQVLLIDADLRRPTTHDVFGLPNVRGLGDSLVDPGPLSLLQVNDRLSLLPAGTAQAHPASTLASEHLRSLVERARESFDWILMDTPPIGLLSDAKLLASVADTALLVAWAGRTAYDSLQRAADALGADRIFGVVLNHVNNATLPDSSYAGYGYSEGEPGGGESPRQSE
jgi:capsular exopolysaccharide synthesis family protein